MICRCAPRITEVRNINVPKCYSITIVCQNGGINEETIMRNIMLVMMSLARKIIVMSDLFNSKLERYFKNCFLKILFRFRVVCQEPSTYVNFTCHISRTGYLTPVICGVHWVTDLYFSCLKYWYRGLARVEFRVQIIDVKIIINI